MTIPAAAVAQLASQLGGPIVIRKVGLINVFQSLFATKYAALSVMVTESASLAEQEPLNDDTMSGVHAGDPLDAPGPTTDAGKCKQRGDETLLHSLPSQPQHMGDPHPQQRQPAAGTNTVGI